MMVSPYQFVGNFSFGGKEVVYEETRELGQGGPVLGNIRIDGQLVCYNKATAEFGGPLLLDNGWLYAPLLTRFRFRVSVIDVESCTILRTSSVEEDLILLASTDGNTVFYYTDLANEKLKKLRL